MYGRRISRPPLGFDNRTVRPVASRYTDWAIPAYCLDERNCSYTKTEQKTKI